jgi:CBS domain-containing protein
MITCPLCDFSNIQGVDLCEQCGQPLNDLHLPMPRNAVERGLLVDKVDTLSPNRAIVVQASTPIRDVLKLLVERQIGCVFVVEGEQMVGVFSERDALMRLNVDAAELADEPVSRFMTPNPQSLTGTAKLAFAVHRMDLGGYRHVPIVDGDGRVLGVISVRDILRYLAGKIAIATGRS